MGLEQPSRFSLSKRRSIRRLLLASFCRMILFTRNPFGRPVSDKADTLLDAGNDVGFRVFQKIFQPGRGFFACLRTRLFKPRTGVMSSFEKPSLPFHQATGPGSLTSFRTVSHALRVP